MIQRINSIDQSANFRHSLWNIFKNRDGRPAGKTLGLEREEMAGAAPYSDERAREIIADHMGLEGPALPILHALQAEFGHVPEAAVKEMAEALNVSRAEMHGVVTFIMTFTASRMVVIL